ncbi:MAG: hypothetical protein HY717_10315 [Planctomycetes bacterium]|nr:hypothetical protein [Planctomycetota bacterium]
MKRSVVFLSVLASLVIFSETSFGQIKFALGFKLANLDGSPLACDGEIKGAPGSTVKFNVIATLTQSDFESGKGASGFSIGYKAEKAHLLGVPGASVSNTCSDAATACPLLGGPPCPDGETSDTCHNGDQTTAASGASCGHGDVIIPITEFFCSASTVDPAKTPDSGPLAGGPQGEGYVDGLAFLIGKSIAGNSTADVGRVTAEVTVPESEDGTVVRFFFADGLQGSGQPVKNGITSGGKTIDQATGRLTLGECRLTVRPQPPVVNLVAEAVGPGTGGGGNGAPIEVPVPLGEKGKLTAYLAIDSTISGDEGVSGWQFSLSYSPDFNVLSIVPADELFAAVPALGGTLGFNETYHSEGTAPSWVDAAAIYTKVDPILEADCDLTDGAPQGKGIVSGVVLAIPPGAGKLLPTSGKVRVLKIEMEQASPFTSLGDANLSPNLMWVDCHFGPGIKIKNRVTVKGGSVPPTEVKNVTEADFVLVPVLAKADFIRGDANDDGKVNIADPIYIINANFRGGPPVLCKDAGDANDSDSVDDPNLADAVYIINHQFGGGSAPPPPFPGCGTDDDSSTDRCPPGSTKCP